MIRITCTNCQKPLSLDETKLPPDKEVAFPCPVCKTRLTVDRRSLESKQKAFLALVMGGPNAYKGKHMRAAHAHLVRRGLTDRHFDAVVKHLRDTMEELRFPVGAAAQILAAAGSIRNEVLGR